MATTETSDGWTYVRNENNVITLINNEVHTPQELREVITEAQETTQQQAMSGAKTE